MYHAGCNSESQIQGYNVGDEVKVYCSFKYWGCLLSNNVKTKEQLLNNCVWMIFNYHCKHQIKRKLKTYFLCQERSKWQEQAGSKPWAHKSKYWTYYVIHSVDVLQWVFDDLGFYWHHLYKILFSTWISLNKISSFFFHLMNLLTPWFNKKCSENVMWH